MKWTLDAILEECRKYEWVIDDYGAIRTDKPVLECECPRGVLPESPGPLPILGDYFPGEDPRTSDLVTCAADCLDPGSTGDHDPPITNDEIQAVRRRMIQELGAKEIRDAD